MFLFTDIVSFRTVLVEQCQPLGQPSLKNQQMLHAGERFGYGLQEQGGNSQMTFILVKQEVCVYHSSIKKIKCSDFFAPSQNLNFCPPPTGIIQ